MRKIYDEQNSSLKNSAYKKDFAEKVKKVKNIVDEKDQELDNMQDNITDDWRDAITSEKINYLNSYTYNYHSKNTIS